jgi:hypothetical protein
MTGAWHSVPQHENIRADNPVGLSNRLNRSAQYATAIVVAHLLVSIVHGLAHNELRVGLAPVNELFVIVVVFVGPLIATMLLWTAKQRLGLILLSLSMFGSSLFGLYHHFLAVSPDHIHSQPSGGWGTTFVLTSYLLLITEIIGTYVGVHFLRIAKGSSPKA